MRVRAFAEEDAAAVASLWRYWFRDKVRGPAPDLETLARRVYLERPGTDPEIVSLVAEDDAGRLAGFLGTTVTTVRVDGRTGRLAGVFPPLVDPERGPTSLASFLLRRFLTGPQDLTLSDGGHPKFERVWEALGGRVAPLASLRWVKVFRPIRLGLESGGLGASVRRVARPLAGGLDAIGRLAAPARLTATPVELPGGRSAPRPAQLDAQAATPGAWGAVIERLQAEARLRPIYRPVDLSWLFGQMSAIDRLGPLRVATAHDAADRPVGAWVATLPAGGLGRVFSLEADRKHEASVFAALLTDADAAGVGALTGRLAARWRRPMTDAGCFVHSGGSLQMLHAHDRTLLDDALLGRLAFSRLDAESWYWWAIPSGREA